MKSMSEKIAHYLIEMRARQLKEGVKEKALEFFSDTFACMLAGANETATQIVKEYVCSEGGKAAAYIYGSHIRSDACHSAMVNGVAAHFHDYDDVCTTMIGHPSVAVLPAVLAAGEETSADGSAVLRAYITGIETCALMGRAYIPEHCRRGWHSTETIGVFGAAAAAAELLKLTEEELVNAIGIAASESCGLKGNTGSMTKPLHAGRAASKGIMAAKLAQKGFTSNRTIMEMDAGFTKVTTGVCHEDKLEEAMKIQNSEFLDKGLIMKPWPACKATHNGIWAMLSLLNKYDIKPEEIRHIDCKVLPYAGDILRYSIAKTPTEGKFSMNYCIALIVLQRKLTMQDFEGDTVRDKTLIEMMKRIDMILDDTLIPGAYFDALESTQVEVTLKNGIVLKERCDFAKGGPNNPMTREEMGEKWRDCMKRAVREEGIDPILKMLSDLEKIKDIHILAEEVEKYILE